MPLTDVQINSRNDMFGQLELMSSKEKQLEYQENVPIAHVSDELFWGWASAYTDICNQPWFDKIYTAREHEILNSLDAEINRIRSSLPNNLPSIEDLINSPKWSELAEVGQQALVDLRIK